MAHLQYLPGDPHLVDQLVYELKSKGIFDKFRKECIADVDTRPAYQNLRQRVESSVGMFLARQTWKPELNKNQLREKLRKHLLDGNYLEQGVERIVDQVVNPKVASVFIPQVEDLVYNYLGIPRKKTAAPESAETSNGKTEDLLPTDLEAVSPGSVKSNDEKNDEMDTTEPKDEAKMDVDEQESKADEQDDSIIEIIDEKEKIEETRMSVINELTQDSVISIDKSTTTIPLPTEEIKLENIPAPENSPPKINDKKIDLEKIDLPKEPNLSTDIPLPDEMPKIERDTYFKPLTLNSEDEETSSDSSLRRNMSPLTPIRNFNNENSCDAQQAFENDSDGKNDDKKEPSTFRFTIESKSSENSSEAVKNEKKLPEIPDQLSYEFTNQVNINTYNTPVYEDSSNSNNLHIDYESDVNSKATVEAKVTEPDQNSGDSKKEKKPEEKRSHKSSHRSRDSHRHSSSKGKRSDSKQSSSRDSSRLDKKSSKDDKSKSSSHKERSSDRSEKKDSRDSSKHRSSHKSSSHKDSKHRSSSSSKHSSKHDDKKSSSSSNKEKDKSDKSKDRSKDSKSSSHRSDKGKDRKSSKTKDDKENKEKKEKKETDDHYSLSGRGIPKRRSTDRDSNDGSSSSKGSHNPPSSKSTESKKDNKNSSKSDNTSTSGDSTNPSDKEVITCNEVKNISQSKPVVRVDTRLESPIATPPRLPFVPDVTLKKPRFAANFHEAKRMMKMRKFLEEEQKRMNQEAALLLEFQANVRPSLSQVYSSIPGPELEFVCMSNSEPTKSQGGVEASTDTKPMEIDINTDINKIKVEENVQIKPETNIETNNEPLIEEKDEIKEEHKDLITETLIAMHLGNDFVEKADEQENIDEVKVITENIPTIETFDSELTDRDVIQALTNNDDKNKIETTENTTSIANESIGKVEGVSIDSKDVKHDKTPKPADFEVTIITEELSEEESKEIMNTDNKIEAFKHPEEKELQYFAEHEKYKAELERDQFSKFLKTFTENANTNKLYLINCDTYEENLIRDASETFGNFQIVNYHKNGHLKLSQTAKNIVKNVNLATELKLPAKLTDNSEKTVFSPVKSECSFELSSDYDAKLEEMVNNTSRKEIMEIILGNVIDESPSKMPQIDYCMESSIESETENGLKRKISDVESSVNNNRAVLTPNKIRKISDSEQISSTTEETEGSANNNLVPSNTRSKYLCRARRVGLPRPKKAALSISPSSDKSVENYTQNECAERTERPPNGKPPRKIQRYDTSDLYKPKLHYLSRRNQVT